MAHGTERTIAQSTAAERTRELRTRADLLGLESLFSAEELAFRDEVRGFVDEAIRPHVADWFERAEFPRELVREMGERGYLGIHLDSPGCPGRSAVEYGLASLEFESADAGIRTFVSVQGSLAMGAIHHWGSEEQKAEHLPAMARGEVIGCFGLTEPNAGSDPSSMETVARRDGGDWVISGRKRWIGLASIAQLAVIWARTEDGVRGFVVPTDTPGFTATVIEPKFAMRASIQCEIELAEVRVPDSARLPGAEGLSGPFTCLNDARYGIMWGVLGAARDSYETACSYALDREQFGAPIASFQLTQRKLVDMALDIQRGLLVAERTGRLKDAGELDPVQISVGKLANTRDAIAICREARTILGGNGVSAEYSPQRHANNLEAVRTYEGTDEVHTLILGAHLTGIPAFNPPREG
ncbi:acyl-CoA dehydrogenase family protein [Brevibacterium pityocampae]|uniref:glutaryl-CoA dehydrogenase (ETF) n=1 Tax=Brevibacterium pityocampae TaxID=506594 RepID=A0ABP8JP59_9MICO